MDVHSHVGSISQRPRMSPSHAEFEESGRLHQARDHQGNADIKIQVTRVTISMPSLTCPMSLIAWVIRGELCGLAAV
eukprot:10898469-Karenia_brevis.AAC.1